MGERKTARQITHEKVQKGRSGLKIQVRKQSQQERKNGRGETEAVIESLV